jgi:protein-S-isoprenylcysteine O-methyltransferase Ste14
VSYNLVTVALALFGTLFFYLQAVAEEEHCLKTFDRQYRDYAVRVPRFNIVAGVFRLLRNRSSA